MGKNLRAAVASVAVKPKGDVTLADVRDPRDAIALGPGDDFEEN